MVKVRNATHADVPAIIELVKASWARTYDPVIGIEKRRAISNAKHVPGLFEKEIDDQGAASVVAVSDENAIIGHVGGQLRGDRTFFVDHLHVEKAFHGKSVAGAIIDALVSEVAEIADCIELTVLTNNDRAIGFYEKAGFVPSKGANEDSGLGGVPSILMRKTIS